MSSSGEFCLYHIVRNKILYRNTIVLLYQWTHESWIIWKSFSNTRFCLFWLFRENIRYNMHHLTLISNSLILSTRVIVFIIIFSTRFWFERSIFVLSDEKRSQVQSTFFFLDFEELNGMFNKVSATTPNFGVEHCLFP